MDLTPNHCETFESCEKPTGLSGFSNFSRYKSRLLRLIWRSFRNPSTFPTRVHIPCHFLQGTRSGIASFSRAAFPCRNGGHRSAGVVVGSLGNHLLGGPVRPGCEHPRRGVFELGSFGRRLIGGRQNRRGGASVCGGA